MADIAGEKTAGERLLPWLPMVVCAAYTMALVDGNYGVSYFFYGYQHGFVKRGLLGELFLHVHHLSRGEVRLMMGALLLVLLAAAYAMFRDVLFRDRAMIPLATVLLCGSAMLPHFFVMFMPTDILLFLLLLSSVWLFLRGSGGIAWAVSLLAGMVALLLHEAYSVRFYPLLIAIFFELCRRGKMRWSAAAAHIATMVVVFGLIFHFGTSRTPPVVFATEAQARSGFYVDPQVFILMHMTAAEARADSLDFMWNRGFLQLFALSFVLAMPYLVLTVYLLRRAMRAAGASRMQGVLTGLLFLSPMMLCPITTDWFRWLSDCIICATLFVFYLYYADAEGGAVRQTLRDYSRNGPMAALLGYVIAIGPFSGMWLFAANTINHGYFDRIIIPHHLK